MTFAQGLALYGAALLASLHCAGMCGGFVACYSAPLRHAGRGVFGSHLSYQLSRWLAYVLLGALAGGLGAGLNQLVAPRGLTSVSAWLACLGLIGSGLYGIWRPGGSAGGSSGSQAGGPSARLLTLRRGPSRLRPALFGLITPLLPCGVLYGFVLVAAGSGSALSGALVLTLLWLGSAPALLGLGWLVSSLSPRLRGSVPRALAVLSVVAGVTGLGLRIGAWTAPPDAPPSCHGAAR